MDRLYLMEIFVAVVETGGFASAARRLGISPPVVTRAINTLEAHLNVQLIHRTTRALRVTDLGYQYFADIQRVIEAASNADDNVSGALSEPQGRLVITAPVLFGRIYITPVVVDFLKRFPKVDVTAHFVDRVVDMLEEGIDLAIRIGELADSGYRAKNIGNSRIIACASRKYLKKYGTPQSPADLKDHTLIATTSGGDSRTWRFKGLPSGRICNYSARLTVSTNDSAIAAARTGFGLARVLSYQVAEDLAAGKLIRVLEKYEPTPLPIHIVHHENRTGTAAMRQFMHMLDTHLKAGRVDANLL
ncbi:MAG: LysR family transcriptional regulator [Gammaproteobacteria bacterium]